MTAAADALGRTRPALSRRISRLERHLGTPLLLRTPRRCVPTDGAGSSSTPRSGPTVSGAPPYAGRGPSRAAYRQRRQLPTR
ncbi:LysR family transcriptional regulator [Micromonospora schwarzwaldensis]|uniref:helix-turn-helix domain-containing protein n=1 Tax=Micromonospora sp. DSM 45708 TaxID=3111767 RepID=UPI0031DCD9DA